MADIDIMEDNSAFMELDNMLNEAWANGYIDGYVSVIRKEPDYCEDREDYEGRLLEEYESGHYSAIQDNVKWTGEYARAKGYIDGLKTSKLDWEDFGFLAFWTAEYTGVLLKKYYVGYYDGFFKNYAKQKDYEWALGFLNQLRKLQARISILPRVPLYEKDYHNDHGYLHYPAAYEEGYETAKKFCQFNTIADAERAINFTKKTQWTIGFIDGKYQRDKRFRFKSNNRNSLQSRTIFDEYSFEYDDGYKAGSGELIREMVNKGIDYWKYNSSEINIESTEDEINKELIWGTGYVDGRMYGILKYRGYNNAENAIYKEGYDIGFSELKEERLENNDNASVTIHSAEAKGFSDAMKYNHMINYGYDRFRFRAYRTGFYRKVLLFGYTPENGNSSEDITDYLKSIIIPQSSNYINNKLEAWKLGVKSGFTGYSARPNNNIFFCAEDNDIYNLNDESFAHNIESDLYNSYKEGCKFGYEHTFFYRWDFAHDVGYSDGEDYAIGRTNVHQESRGKFKGFELDAYDKGFSEALDSAYNEKESEENTGGSSYEWTKEDAWDAMTDDMYGDYKGDVDFDKFGF